MWPKNAGFPGFLVLFCRYLIGIVWRGTGASQEIRLHTTTQIHQQMPTSSTFQVKFKLTISMFDWYKAMDILERAIIVGIGKIVRM